MPHRWKWISALIIAAMLGFGWWVRQRTARPAPHPLAAAAASRPPLTSLWPAPIPTAAPKGGDAADEIAVCGIGKVKLDPDDWTATGKYLELLTTNSRGRWLAGLRNSDDYRARAAGLYLEGIFDRDSPQKDPEAARDELVQLAVGAKDPAAFALAYIKCIKGVEDVASQGECPGLSVEAWTRADPNNAVPWLQLAAKARRDNDAAAEAAAFAQAAHALRYETYNWSLFSFAQSAIPEDATPTERWILTTQLIGVEAAMPMPFLTLMQYCSRNALSDAAVYRQCNSLAELMVATSTTLSELSLGKSLGARLGWPAERVDKLTQEVKASMQAINLMTGLDPKQQWSCDSVARGNAYMSQLKDLGERGMASLAIERSGESAEELARQFDQWLATFTRP